METLIDNPELSRTIAGTATMKIASIPSSNLFYTPIEERFERITRLARRALNVPVAAVTLVNAEKQWFKSISGWTVSELPRDQSLCRWTVDTSQMTVIEDLLADPRTVAHQLVETGPQFRFYAGCPLKDLNNSLIGTFCIFDVKARRFSPMDRQTLRDFAALTHREFHVEELASAHTQLTAKLSIARREAMMDPLTRLWNRRGALSMLQAACDNSDRTGSPLAVALLDVDNFKSINDGYSHQVGDEVLRRLGSRLIASIRNNDIVCRIGGDEFLLMMEETSDKIASTIAERVRRAITATPITTRHGSIPVSISLGFTIRQPKEDLSTEQLLERADKGLLHSKAAGRNIVSSVE